MAGAIFDDACDYLLHAVRHLQNGDTGVPVAATGGLGPTLLTRIAKHGLSRP